MPRKTRQRTGQPRKQRLFAYGPQRITLTSQIADLQLTAADPSAEGQRPKVRAFSMTAYTGGQMTVAGYYWPVVVDLAGMTVRSQTRPILYSHDTAQIVGHSEKISVTAQTIKVSGKVSGISAAASEVTALGDNGFPWQASIGAEVQQLEFVDRGNTVKVNGRNVSGPVYVARRTSLREISFAALGADDNTTASIAASLTPQEHRSMEFSQWLSANGFDAQSLTGTQLDILQSAFEATGADLPDDDSDDADDEPAKSPKPVAAAVDAQSIQKQVREIQAAEADRTSSIKLVCAKYGVSSARIDGKEVASLEAHAIREGWSAEKTELEALRASRPTSPAIHVAQDFSGNLSVLECAVAKSAQLPDREQRFDVRTLDAADKQYRTGVGLQRLLIMAASAAGFPVPLGPIRQVSRDFLRAAFTMHEISGNEWERALVQAKALAALERLLTPDLLRDFMKLQDSPYGFRTDKVYTPEVVRRCLIQAWLAGAKVSGNQFNIIAGNCYLTKEFYRAAILATEGVANLKLTIGTPQRYGERAMACEAKAEWTFGGRSQELKFLKTAELDARIVVNSHSSSGPDEIRGRVESKLYQRVLSVLRGMNHDADEVIEAETIEGSLSSSPLLPADLVTNAPEVANPGLPDADVAMEILEAFESDVSGMTSVAAIRKLVHDRECLINSAQWSSSLKEATRHSVQLAAEDRVEEIRSSRGEGSNRS